MLSLVPLAMLMCVWVGIEKGHESIQLGIDLVELQWNQPARNIYNINNQRFIEPEPLNHLLVSFQITDF